MKLGEMTELFKKHDDKYLEFGGEACILSRRADLYAFSLLDHICPGTNDVIRSAEHDVVWLEFDPSTVALNINEEQIEVLVRCGVRIDPEGRGFYMFI